MFDLHVHSARSDGTDDPTTLAAIALGAGLSGFALTDHDTTAGIEAAQESADKLKVLFIPGIELTSMHGDDVVHILGYFIDPGHVALVEQTQRLTDSRAARAREIVTRLSVDYPITWEDVVAHAGDPRAIGRPHVADALIRRGVVSSRPEAFAGLLHEHSRYFASIEAPPVPTAIKAILAAGGVPVAAHLRGDQRPANGVDEVAISSWADLGLRGIEVNHREHSPAAVSELSAITEHLNLLPTGGSDYHGTGKPNRFGENATPTHIVEQLRAAVEAPA